MLNNTKSILCGLVCATALTGSAMAGGFSRGTADTDVLFEDGNFTMRSGVLYVAPQRAYETISLGFPAAASTAGTDGNYTDAYVIPSVAIKLNLTDSARCAGTYTQPFGADATYGSQYTQAGIDSDLRDGNFATPSGTSYSNFNTDEFALTCGYRFAAGKGNVWIFGGGFLQSIEYNEGNIIGATVASGTLGALALSESMVPGYRLGVAYEIPEIALRVQGIYRSSVTHSLDGVFTLGGAPINTAAIGSATLPQSFELKAQTGIAPGWLAFGSVKWTDWSVFDTLTYTAASPALLLEKDFYYQDGWTVSGGIGHQFNDMVSGSLSLTWDKGVSTTEDVNRDTYTLAAGVAVSDDNRGELRFGGALSYLQGGSVSAAANCDGAGGDCGDGVGTAFDYSVGNDWSFALGASYKVSF